MKKRLMLVLLAVLCVVMLAACGECEHDWEKATCEEPKTCSECGETKGKAKGHEWVDATCEEPKTCSECGETEGEALEHDWQDATCEEPKTCANCGETKGEADGHDWQDATYDAPKTCSECGLTEGEHLTRPVSSGSDMGISYEEYVAKINASLGGDEYQLVYLTSTEDGKPIYGVYNQNGDYLDVLATFEVAADGKTVISLVVATTEITDSDKVYATGFISGVAWALTNSQLTSDMVSDMMAGEPQVESDGTISYHMENNGLDYYVIITSDMMIFSVDAG